MGAGNGDNQMKIIVAEFWIVANSNFDLLNPVKCTREQTCELMPEGLSDF